MKTRLGSKSKRRRRRRFASKKNEKIDGALGAKLKKRRAEGELGVEVKIKEKGLKASLGSK